MTILLMRFVGPDVRIRGESFWLCGERNAERSGRLFRSDTRASVAFLPRRSGKGLNIRELCLTRVFSIHSHRSHSALISTSGKPHYFHISKSLGPWTCSGTTPLSDPPSHVFKVSATLRSSWLASPTRPLRRTIRRRMQHWTTIQLRSRWTRACTLMQRMRLLF